MGLICMSVVHILSSQRQHSWLNAVCDRTTESLSASSCVCGVNEKLLASDTHLSLFPKQICFSFLENRSWLWVKVLEEHTRDRRNLLLLRDFCAASEILDSVDVEDKTIPILATRTQRWAASNCE